MIDPDVQFVHDRVLIWRTANGVTSARIYLLDASGYPHMDVGKLEMMFVDGLGVYRPVFFSEPPRTIARA